MAGARGRTRTRRPVRRRADGNLATAEILETDETITDLHGTAVERDGRLDRPSFHPAAGLYDRSKVGAIESALGAAFEDA